VAAVAAKSDSGRREKRIKRNGLLKRGKDVQSSIGQRLYATRDSTLSTRPRRPPRRSPLYSAASNVELPSTHTRLQAAVCQARQSTPTPATPIADPRMRETHLIFSRTFSSFARDEPSYACRRQHKPHARPNPRLRPHASPTKPGSHQPPRPKLLSSRRRSCLQPHRLPKRIRGPADA
jgi:hypothetical protein